MIKTRRTKRTFSPEFKLEAIEQVVKYQRDVREVALTPDGQQNPRPGYVLQ
jgi:transposase